MILLDVVLDFLRMSRTECYFSDQFSIIAGTENLPRKFRNCYRGDHLFTKVVISLDVFFNFYQTLRVESKFWREISHSHWPKQTRWRRSLSVVAQTRWWRRVGGDALWFRRVGVDTLVETRWRRRVEADVREADVSGFLKNEQSIFPYQIFFPDEPKM